MNMPAQKPGKSRQDYATPPEFLLAVKERLHIKEFWYDLAAAAENTTALQFYSEAEDSLKQEWFAMPGWSWLNPPFGKLEPWVQKAWAAKLLGFQIAVLVPASVGSNWWANWVHEEAHVLFLRPRLQFVGAKDPYPKDLALLLYHPAIHGGYDTWSWK